MAHELDCSTGRYGIAYVGQKPWHGNGQELTENAPLEVWTKEAGLDWEAIESPVFAKFGNDEILLPQKALIRSDTKFHLSTVSPDYKVVQPKDVMEFYRDLIEHQGYRMETAGSLKNGKIIWGLARTPNHIDMGEDVVNGYLLLATSFDRSMATRAMVTGVRVVCNNTLMASFSGSGKDWISITHGAVFDKERVQKKLGVYDDSWKIYSDNLYKLANKKITDNEAKDFFVKLMVKDETAVAMEHLYKPNIMNIYQMYSGKGMGSKLDSAANTLWGAVNAITQFVDHQMGNQKNRLASAWFGVGSKLKQEAFETALKMAA